jgi:hypothetical protein
MTSCDARPDHTLGIGLRYAVSRGGSLGESYVATGGFMRSDPALAVSDTIVVMAPALITRGGVGWRLTDLFPERHGFTVMVLDPWTLQDLLATIPEHCAFRLSLGGRNAHRDPGVCPRPSFGGIGTGGPTITQAHRAIEAAVAEDRQEVTWVL